MLIQSRRERQLRQALSAYADAMLAKMPTEAEFAAQYNFSPEFEERMARLVQRARQEAGLPAARPATAVASEAGVPSATVATANPRQADIPDISGAPGSQKRLDIPLAGAPSAPRMPHRGKRVLVAAIILAILMSMIGIVAAREPIARFFVSVYEKFSRVVFNTPETPDVPVTPGANGTQASGATGSATAPIAGAKAGAASAAAKVPTWVPEGYREIQRTEYDEFTQIKFINQDNVELHFERQSTSTVELVIDTELVPVERILIGGHEAMLYVNKGILNLIWQENAYAYFISGKITKDSALHIANSTK